MHIETLTSAVGIFSKTALFICILDNLSANKSLVKLAHQFAIYNYKNFMEAIAYLRKSSIRRNTNCIAYLFVELNQFARFPTASFQYFGALFFRV